MTAKIDLNLSNSATFTFFSSPSFFCLALTIFPPFFLPYNSGIFRLNKCNKHDYLALFHSNGCNLHSYSVHFCYSNTETNTTYIIFYNLFYS